MKNKAKKLNPYKRSIHIDGEEWTYQFTKSKVGESGYLKVCNPQRTKKYTIDIPRMGKSGALEDYESCPEEYDGDGSDLYKVAVTPKHVKKIIIKNIISS